MRNKMKPRDIRQRQADDKKRKIMFREMQKAVKKAGAAGEDSLSEALRPLVEGGEDKELRDLLLWRTDGPKPEGTQVDSVLVTPHAIYVIEMKNFRGTVTGKEEGDYWKHVKPEGSYDKVYNPVRQNQGHISAVMNALKDSPPHPWVHVIGMVVFSDMCELRVETGEKLVCNVRDVADIVRANAESMKPVLSQADVEALAGHIERKNDTSPEGRNAHLRLARISRERKERIHKGEDITPEVERHLELLNVPTKLEGDIIVRLGANRYETIADVYREALRAQDGGPIRRHMPPVSFVCPFTGKEYKGEGNIETFYNGMIAMYLSQDRDFAREVVEKSRDGRYLSTGVPRYDRALNSFGADPERFIQAIRDSDWFRDTAKTQRRLDDIIGNAIARTGSGRTTRRAREPELLVS